MSNQNSDNETTDHGNEANEYRKWFLQLQNDTVDPEQTARLAELAASLPLERFEALAGAMAEDDAAEEMWQAVLNDELPAVANVPHFDLSFLPSHAQAATGVDTETARKASAPWATEIVEEAVRQGKQWIQDQTDAIYILIGGQFQGGLAPTLTTRSGEDSGSNLSGNQLLDFVLGEEDGLAWEVEVTAFATDERTCQLEISLLHEELDNAEIPVTISLGEYHQTKATDESGVVIFDRVPSPQIDQLVIRIAPDSE